MSKKRKINKVSATSKKTTRKARDHRHAVHLTPREQRAQQEILAFLSANRQEGFTCKQVGAATGLWQELGNNKLRSLLDGLADRGRVEYLDKGRYRYMSAAALVAGELQVTRSGVGFLLQEDGSDVFISPSNMGKALHGDTVKARLLARRRREGRPEGEIVEIVQRGRNQFVGTVEEGLPGLYFMIPDDTRINTDFRIAKDKHMDARPGDKVLVRILSWEGRAPEAEVVSVLGAAGEHQTEMHAILLQYDFQPHFPPEVEAEAARIPVEISNEERSRRRDMRGITTFTIDPYDAKDFDDALSIRKLENGNYEIGVHIADVAHYVRPGSLIDKEGFARATSVYLVDRTVPMLPEKLSNLVCSLRPHEEKLTYSAIFEMDDEARVVHYWIGRTVIYSDHRFTYEEAQDILEGKSEGPFADELMVLDRLAKKLRKARFATGSVEFDSQEVKFVLDENDKPVRVVKKEMKDSNQLIEDFMLLANRTVAAHIFNLEKNPPLPSVYRIHDSPNPEKLAGLQLFVSGFGHKVDFQQTRDMATSLNELLRAVQGRPEQHVIETIAVRSMAKAIYSTKNIGHFGLGFTYYTHFTSPIRRYPDLMVQRLLTAYHQKQYQENPTVMEAQLKHCSEKERTAAEAERASIRYKQVEFLAERIGQRFGGLISGVIEAGFFVELEENLCEGFVPVATLDDDYYSYESEQYALVGRTHGKVLRLGDPVEIEIAGTDLKRRSVEMRLVAKR
ncbi:MAG: ribonuclease R [Bacteroidia bacterium]